MFCRWSSRILFWTLTVLLTLAVVAWTRSYHFPFQAEAWQGKRHYSMRVRDGILTASWLQDDCNGSIRQWERWLASSKWARFHWFWWDLPDAALRRERMYPVFPLRALDVEFTTANIHWDKSSSDCVLVRRVGIPFYLLVLALAPVWATMLAISLLLRWRRSRRRLRLGLCLRCGYDLRASPERCPECGTLRGAIRRSMPNEESE